MARCDENNVNPILDFILNTPCNEEIVAMDCNDFCEQLAELAELVAEGGSLEELRPALEEHLRHWPDCREEFDALVAILKAEKNSPTPDPEKTS